MNFPFSHPPDARIASYVDGTPRRLGRRTPLADLPIVVLDAETTGFRVGSDRMLSIATMPVRRGRAMLGELRDWLIDQPGAEVTAATRIHTILPCDSSNGRPEEDVLREVCEVLTGSVLVGHHIGFDAAMIDEGMKRHFGSGLRNVMIDTAQLAMRVVDAFRRTGYGSQRPPGLDEVAAQLGLPLWERHTAEGDAFATAQLFLLLCARLRRKLGRELVLGDLPVTRGPG